MLDGLDNSWLLWLRSVTIDNFMFINWLFTAIHSWTCLSITSLFYQFLGCLGLNYLQCFWGLKQMRFGTLLSRSNMRAVNMLLHRARKNTGILILYCWFLAEVANQVPAVVRVFEAATRRQTSKTPNCSKREVGWKIVGLFGKVWTVSSFLP